MGSKEWTPTLPKAPSFMLDQKYGNKPTIASAYDDDDNTAKKKKKNVVVAKGGTKQLSPTTLATETSSFSYSTVASNSPTSRDDGGMGAFEEHIVPPQVCS